MFSAIALTPCLGFGQQIFTYSATDFQAQTYLAPTHASIQVRTVFVVMGNPNAMARVTGSTRSVDVRIKPPEGTAMLVRTTLKGKLLETSIKGSNIDGEMIGSVKLPAEFAAEDVTLLWRLEDGSILETSASPK